MTAIDDFLKACEPPSRMPLAQRPHLADAALVEVIHQLRDLQRAALAGPPVVQLSVRMTWLGWIRRALGRGLPAV